MGLTRLKLGKCFSWTFHSNLKPKAQHILYFPFQHPYIIPHAYTSIPVYVSLFISFQFVCRV